MRLFRDAPDELDLSDPAHQEAADQIAERVLAEYPTREALAALEADLCAGPDEVPLIGHLAVKLARSWSAVALLPTPLTISVVFAVYRETTRMLRREEHEHGEDFLRVKLAQLDRLFGRRDGIDWELIVVDDGCPEESGRMAETILADHPLGGRGRVLFLERAIAGRHPTARGLATTDDSRKGGSIQHGMYEAVRGSGANQVVVFTDADLSTHLGQTGLLAEGIVTGADAAIGSRREPTSIVVKKGVRNTRGKLFIYLWKRLLPDLGKVVDTQCGFKAFRGDRVRDLVTGTDEKGFAFDAELLLRTELRRRNSITRIPIAWIDSEAASTTTGINPYLGMLESMAGMYRKYLQENPEAETFAELIDDLDEEAWDRLVANIPTEIADGDPKEFYRFRCISAADLRSAAR